MKSGKTLLASIAISAAVAAPASAEHWNGERVETETRIYEERIEPQQRIYEERIDPPSSGYYEQQPRSIVRETWTETAPAPVVVTNREHFRDGRCDVTRTYLSDGTTDEERVCPRLLLPHEYLIDRIGRHFDRLRGY